MGSGILGGPHCPVCAAMLTDDVYDELTHARLPRNVLESLRKRYQATYSCPFCENSLDRECGPIPNALPSDPLL